MPSKSREWQNRADGSVWVIGGSISSDDLPALRETRYLTLYDTKVRPGVLQELSALELLDLRTTSVAAVDEISALPRLRALSLSHNRTVSDFSAIQRVRTLELLELYALSRLTALPRMNELDGLRRVNLGQLIRLDDWSAVLEARALETLELQNKLSPDLDVLRQLAGSTAFRYFTWSAPDVGQSKVAAAHTAASREKPNYLRIRDLWK